MQHNFHAGRGGEDFAASPGQILQFDNNDIVYIQFKLQFFIDG